MNTLRKFIKKIAKSNSNNRLKEEVLSSNNLQNTVNEKSAENQEIPVENVVSQEEIEKKKKDYETAKAVFGPGYDTYLEIKRLEALQKDEKPQRKTVNLPNKYINSHLHPYTAQQRCFYRGIILRILYKIYEEERRSEKCKRPTCDKNFNDILDPNNIINYTYISYEDYSGSPLTIYKNLHDFRYVEKYYKKDIAA